MTGAGGSGIRLQCLPQVRWEDSEFFPVFGDGPTGDLGATLFQDVHHLLVGEGVD